MSTRALKINNGIVKSPKRIGIFNIKNMVTISWTTVTDKGVTFTNNGDGTVTINGTATADVYESFKTGITLPQNYKIAIRGCPSGGSKETYFIGSNKGNPGGDIGKTIDTGTGESVVCDLSKLTGSFIQYIMIKKGYTANNLVFRPQVYNLSEVGVSSTKSYLRVENGIAKVPTTEKTTTYTTEQNASGGTTYTITSNDYSISSGTYTIGGL